MATIACPGCGLPRVESEAANPCPVCAASGSALPEPRRVDREPSPIDRFAADASQLADARETPHHGHRPEIVAIVLGLVIGAGTVLAVQGVLPERVPPEERGHEVAVAEPVAPPLPRSAEPPADDAPVIPAAAEFAEPPAAPVTAPVEDPDKPDFVIDIDRPEDTVQLSRVIFGNSKRAVVRGRAKSVNFYGVEGLNIDALQLVVLDTVSIGGGFKDTVLKVSCPKGRVIISPRITGKSFLVVDAADGEIIFNYPNSGLDGGAIAEMTTRRLEVRGPIAGDGTMVRVTFASGGVFKGVGIHDAAIVEYRKANRGDPPIRIEIPDDQISRAAILRRVE